VLDVIEVLEELVSVPLAPLTFAEQPTCAARSEAPRAIVVVLRVAKSGSKQAIRRLNGIGIGETP
jgi:hypothetical protein